MRSEAHHARRPAVGTVLALFFLWWSVTLLWWALAFASLDGAPEWLVRAQAICFGSSTSALPEDFGWIALIVGPGGMLAGMIVIFHEDLAHAFAALRASVGGTLVVIAVCVTTFAHGAFIAQRITGARAVQQLERELPTLDDAMPEGWPRGTTPAPELGLVDQNGAQVTLASLRGKVVLLTFAFAHCQTICPTLVKRVQNASGELPEDVELLIITLDPWRDTPASLPNIAAGWKLGARQRVLSGDVDRVNAVLDAYHVARGRDEKTGEVAHPAIVTVIDKNGMLAFNLNGPSTDWIADAVDRARR
jgi:cytochrome oxidase Cu insertion factor (SCO1/SenC/PrrC family)